MRNLIKTCLIILPFLQISCDDSSQIHPQNFVGEWNLQWQLKDEEGIFENEEDLSLGGHAVFDANGSAVITAYGGDRSVLLKETSTNYFEWEFDGSTLILKNVESGFTFSYKLKATSSHYLSLFLDNQVEIEFSKVGF